MTNSMIRLSSDVGHRPTCPHGEGGVQLLVAQAPQTRGIGEDLTDHTAPDLGVGPQLALHHREAAGRAHREQVHRAGLRDVQLTYYRERRTVPAREQVRRLEQQRLESCLVVVAGHRRALPAPTAVPDQHGAPFFVDLVSSARASIRRDRARVMSRQRCPSTAPSAAGYRSSAPEAVVGHRQDARATATPGRTS